jgi:hypothetical protein
VLGKKLKGVNFTMNLVIPNKFFIALVILSFLCGNLFAQQTSEFRLYELSIKNKKSLIKSIDIFTEKIRKKEWSEVYDLIYVGTKENQESKEDFIQWQKENIGYVITDFKINEDSILVWSNENMRESVHVLGCLSVLEKGRKFKYSGSVAAERMGSEKWVFNYLPAINPNSVSGGPRAC